MPAGKGIIQKRDLDLVRSALMQGGWHTLAALSKATGIKSEASISARLRDLRKPKYGAYTIERRKLIATTLFQYRLGLAECAPLAHGKTHSEHAGSSC